MSPPARILFIDDCAADIDAATGYLREAGLGVIASAAATEAELRVALSDQDVDLILAEPAVPDLDAVRAAAIARELRPGVPFIVHAAKAEEGTALAARARGVVDAVSKSNPLRLVASVERALHGARLRATRRSSQQSLRDSAQRFRDIVETSPDWIWELDAAGRFTFTNAAVLSMLGHRPNKIIGRDHLELLHPDDVSEMCSTWARIRSEGYGTRGTVARWRTATGEYRWLEKSVLPLTGPDGEVLGFRGWDKDITERRQLEESLRFLADYDPLTGLARRRLFCKRLTQMLPILQQQKLPMVVLIFDLEKLGSINDSLGRRAGDEVLQLVAQRMRQTLRDTESMAHLDGGTFALAFSDAVDAADAAYIVRNEVNRLFAEPVTLDGRSLNLNVRYGIAHFPQDGADPEALLSNAEAALRRAKESGEKYLHFKLQMSTEVAERLSLEADLRSALQQDRYLLLYQPTLQLDDRRIHSAEGLIRWNDPERGVVPPGRFIPLLESTGLILDVGRWVLNRAAADAGKWRRKGFPPLRVAVNVSAVQLREREFVADVLTARTRGATGGVDLDIEITESMLMNDVEATVRKLRELRNAGVRIALDDFGTGYSSLSRLAKLPIDVLKVDRSFVHQVGDGSSGRAVISTIVALAHAFGMSVVAEGVETHEQLRALEELGCDAVQGYLIGRPMAPAALASLLTETVGGGHAAILPGRGLPDGAEAT